MSDPNRAARPPERPLKFDGYQPRPRGGPAPVTLALSLMLLIAVGGGLFFVYRGGPRAPNGAPAPVGIPVGDVSVTAPPQPQTPDPAAGLSIYKDNSGAPPGPPVFAPPPEQPAPRPGMAPLAAPPIAPVAAGPVAALPATQAAKSMVAVLPAKPRPASPTIDTLLAQTSTTSAHASPREADAESAKPEADDRDAKHAGAYVVQIGAFSSPTLADKSWDAAMGLASEDMASKNKHVTVVARADGTKLYRTAITGFSTREQAQALCAKLRSAGKPCFVR